MAERWTLRRVSADSHGWSCLLNGVNHLLFHEPCWGRILEDEFGSAPICCLLEHDGEPVGGFMGFVLRVAGVRMLEVSYPYGGVIGETPDGPTLCSLLSGLADELGVARVRIVGYPGMHPLDENAFEVVKLQSHLLALEDKSADDVWRGYSQNIRRDIKKARRTNTSVEQDASENGASEFYSLYLESMRRNDAMAKYSRRLVESICRHLGPAGRSALFLARHEGRSIAGLVVVDSPTASHYLMGGSLSEYLELRPNHLLMHSAIERARSLGLASFDFLPSGVGDSNLEQFKAKWGAAPIAAPAYTLVTRPVVMRLWEAAYSVANTKLGSLAVRGLQRFRTSTGRG